MTDQNENNVIFEPHSDAELAHILESQLAALRGKVVGSRVQPGDVDAPVFPVEPTWVDSLFDTPTVQMTVAEIRTVASPEISEMPLMFSTSEMAALLANDAPHVRVVPVIWPIGDTEGQHSSVVKSLEAVVTDTKSSDAPSVVGPSGSADLFGHTLEQPKVAHRVPADVNVTGRPSFDDLIMGISLDR